MKKTFVFILIIVFILTSCSTKVNFVNDYRSFENEEYRLQCNLEMFPQTLDDAWTVLDYQFWYRELIWEDAYIYLDICFNNEASFKQELERILNIKGSYYHQTDTFTEDKQNFDLPAYVLSGNDPEWNYSWQYIISLPNENRIVYVFMQTPPTWAVKIPEDYLPRSN